MYAGFKHNPPATRLAPRLLEDMDLVEQAFVSQMKLEAQVEASLTLLV